MLSRAIHTHTKPATILNRYSTFLFSTPQLIYQPHPSINPSPTSRHFTASRAIMTEKVASASIPSSAPGENFEVRQTHPSEDYAPDPSKSLKLSPTRQALVDDILALY